MKMKNKMNKKGFIFGILPLLYLIVALAILIVLVILGFKISAGLVAFWEFLTIWWLPISLMTTGFIFRRQIRSVINLLLGRLGVKV